MSNSKKIVGAKAAALASKSISKAKVGRGGKSVGLLTLLVLSRSDANTCRRILQLAKKTDLNALFGLAKNILNGNVRISPNLLEELRPFERNLLALAERATTFDQKLKSLRKTKFLKLILEIYQRILNRSENLKSESDNDNEDSEREEVKADAEDEDTN